ncbi:MAG: D-alanyl-D-alanine carboxypeptidase [Lachnospiraceae bacterium]|nr:D-alanyl-D-alanine carboxypeptidase [Lachnospiraceae bacterium]
MIQWKRKWVAAALLFAFVCSGCGTASEDEGGLPLAYTGSKSYEYYDVGNDRIADFLSGRGTEVCIPSGVPDNDTSVSESDYVYGLYRLSDNTVLQQHGMLDTIYPASTTKLLTALVALKNCNLSESVTFSYHASHIGVNGAVRCGFEEGDSVMLGDLLAALLIYSGNDAGIAIAEHVSGSVEAFVELMNEEAGRLGAVDTHFVNPHGLHDKEHFTTAYDIYLIMNELISYNTFLSIISMPSCKVEYTDAQGNAKSKSFESTNLFFGGGFEIPKGIEVVGGKTGTTNAAGCCMILYFKDEKGKSYIAEVFHAPSYEVLYGKLTELMKSVVSK